MYVMLLSDLSPTQISLSLLLLTFGPRQVKQMGVDDLAGPRNKGISSNKISPALTTLVDTRILEDKGSRFYLGLINFELHGLEFFHLYVRDVFVI